MVDLPERTRGLSPADVSVPAAGTRAPATTQESFSSAGSSSPTVGVLALQGAVGLHADALAACGVEAVEVRSAAALAAVDALVMPGGESTTMSMLLERTALFDPLAERIGAGLPVLGTCAGMILLAHGVGGGRPDQRSFGAIDLDVERNGYGRQRESFEADLALDGDPDPFPGVFIRAPVVTRTGPAVEVLARIGGAAVWCRQGPVMVTSFHPELSDDRRIHQRFLAMMHTAATMRVDQ